MANENLKPSVEAVAVQVGPDADHTDGPLPSLRLAVFMTGDLGEVIDKVNQHLQVIMGAVDGNDRAEQAVQSVADLLRSYYRAETKKEPGLFIAVKKAVMFKNEWAAICVSNTMARRFARALNLHKQLNRRGF
jgi:hypothetical protein